MGNLHIQCCSFIEDVIALTRSCSYVCSLNIPQSRGLLQIETCDGILASMEDMLGRFQGDLGNISTEIRSLQEQSQNMSVKLKNRKTAEQKLGTFLDSLAITGPLIEGIVQREVDEDYQVSVLIRCTKTCSRSTNMSLCLLEALCLRHGFERCLPLYPDSEESYFLISL